MAIYTLVTGKMAKELDKVLKLLSQWHLYVGGGDDWVNQAEKALLPLVRRVNGQVTCTLVAPDRWQIQRAYGLTVTNT